MNLTLKQIYKTLQKQYEGLDNPNMEAKRLIEAVTGLSASDFITRPDYELSQEWVDLIQKYAARRLKGEPLSKILGVKEFWGLEFAVNAHVLDPRPDTETLIESVLKWVDQQDSVIARNEITTQSISSQFSDSHPKLDVGSRDNISNGSQLSLGCEKRAVACEGEAMGCEEGAMGFDEGNVRCEEENIKCDSKEKPWRILDLGTGSGCIPIALLSELPNASAVAVDISEEALKVAAQNAKKHKMSNRIEFIQSDWFEGVESGNFDIIVSNPPYIPESDIDNLSPEVKNHDPILALSGGDSGLECYKKIIFFLKDKLNGKNMAFLEIGIGQLESLSRLVDDSNLLLCDSVADIGGIPRVVEISCGDK